MHFCDSSAYDTTRGGDASATNTVPPKSSVIATGSPKVARSHARIAHTGSSRSAEVAVAAVESAAVPLFAGGGADAHASEKSTSNDEPSFIAARAVGTRGSRQIYGARTSSSART